LKSIFGKRHKKRRNQTEAYHDRIQKKWNKRFGKPFEFGFSPPTTGPLAEFQRRSRVLRETEPLILSPLIHADFGRLEVRILKAREHAAEVPFFMHVDTGRRFSEDMFPHFELKALPIEHVEPVLAEGVEKPKVSSLMERLIKNRDLDKGST